MHIKKARRILKSLADDTRLRIVNLLNGREMNVTEMLGVIETTQSNLSRHLARLRLTGVVGDRRSGSSVYYRLSKPPDRFHMEVVRAVTEGLSGSSAFLGDIKRLNKIRKTALKNGRR